MRSCIYTNDVLLRVSCTIRKSCARAFVKSNGVYICFFQIKPLEEDKAIADGGDLLAEGFIYGLGTFLSELPEPDYINMCL